MKMRNQYIYIKAMNIKKQEGDYIFISLFDKYNIDEK